ncbi:MAG TPA: exodeoxyribonuclease VII large subunit [Dysgonamonadaceae bacterium]|nr:exodeoxyribonuclease VII large subunit [Dysgonamonadaceae bacterium]
MEQDILSLLELNLSIKEAISQEFDAAYWVRAETSDVRPHRNGHCYLEFIEKAKDGHSIVAKARGTIWASTFNLLKPYFEQETGQAFTSGITVLVRVTVAFHETYGLGLNVVDIDPSYTLGEIARNRMLVLKQLEEEGVLNLNKELSLAEPLNRIAVISSQSAAGYEDFHSQLEHNSEGLIFYKKLFPAIMQGDRSEASIIAALELIYAHKELFDVVVIIRGGGATSDLSCFDSYALATNCAQFPLPIISGIGHERDVTVLDAVAHTRVKTPTAAAEFLINRVATTNNYLMELQDRLVQATRNILAEEEGQLNGWSKDVYHNSKSLLQSNSNTLLFLNEKLRSAVKRKIEKEKFAIERYEHFVLLSLPENMLKRGYSITTRNGKTIKSVSDLTVGDVITTQLLDGEIDSKIVHKK